MQKDELMLKMIEELTESKTIKEIHEIIQEAIERTKKNNPGADMGSITEVFYLIERHLVERARKTKEIIRE